MLEAHIAPVDEKREHGYLISSLDILYLGARGFSPCELQACGDERVVSSCWIVDRQPTRRRSHLIRQMLVYR